MANQSQSPRPLLAAAASREEVRLWDRDWAIPGSVEVGLGEGVGLEVDNERTTSYRMTDKIKWSMSEKWLEIKQESDLVTTNDSQGRE